MKIVTRLIIILFAILFITSCSESAELNKEPDFREDFASDKLSVFRWGKPTFSMYKFKADPKMVFNVSGINYLQLGTPESNIYPSGFIYSKERFQHGSYSARIKITAIPGGVASFFVCSEIAKVFSDGTHDEIDFEFITAKPHSVLLTTWLMATGMEGGEQTPTHNSFLWEDPSFDIRDWHDYRFDWYPDRVDFYIDGKIRWTSRKAIPKRDMQIALHMYTISTWEEVQFPPKGDIYQMTDWVEYRELKNKKQVASSK